MTPQEAGVQSGYGKDVFSRKTTFLELDRCSEARELYGKYPSHHYWGQFLPQLALRKTDCFFLLFLL